MTDLELQRKSLPNEPGVYFFKDSNEEIIYIGKARNLRKRVSQYFVKTSYIDPYYEEKIKDLVKRINSIEFIVTDNEKEASILENIQIKTHLPRYNVIMRDSKSYPWIAIFYSEEFPRIRIIRNPQWYIQENLFLGPYTDKKEIRRILRDLRKIFPYCSCKNKVRKKERPCLYYQLKLCPGPCINAISKEDYLANVKKIELFLKGETEELMNQIKKKMENSAKAQNYEIAAHWRDKLEAIEHSTVSQHVLLDHEVNKDIIGYFNEKNYAALVIIHIREGKITNKSSFKLDLRDKVIQKTDILSSFLEQYYQDFKFNLPKNIVIPELYNGVKILKEILKETNIDLQIRTPLDDEIPLMRIAKKNARVMVNQQIEMEKIKQKEEDQIKKTLELAKVVLKLPKIPRIIEGFDISNIEGTDATGSLIYFLEGNPYNKNYRYFKIRSKSTPDDVAMMKEVIERRYTKVLERGWELPDLILVDGGKGQLNAALGVLEDLSIKNLPIIGLAKKNEEIFLPGEKEPIVLPKTSPVLKLFQRVRDEAHRFAVKLHKKQREKRMRDSILDDIKGIGPATRNKLLKHFGSVEGLKRASYDEILRVVGSKIAEILVKNLK
ncbi:MAG: excinuclease ABC subunit UvrC [Promethearchaeota archaeon]|nr:MAG: excinuclease ABC subunit UvrC [Candidatus Lokiarchaeota archaeon]